MNWNKREIEYLKGNFSSFPDIFLSKHLGKSPNAVRIKASRLKLKKESCITRNTLTLNDKEEQVICGSLLGDMYCRIKKPSSINANIEWAHCANQLEYSYWKSKLLNRLLFNIRETKHNTYHFTSKNYKCLNYYYKLFYPFGKKIVNEQILNKIDKLGLLIWYLDDGSYHKRDKTIRLYTNCFSLSEQIVIQKWFKDKWDIICNIHKVRENEHSLYFPVKETKKLIPLFLQFDVPKCMRYKLGQIDNIYQNPIPGVL